MSIEDELAAAMTTFVTEAEELLRDMESGLLRLEQEPSDDEAVNAVFRAAHTIKGSSGLFGLNHVVAFTHVFETVLDSVRAHELAVTPELVGALLPGVDHIAGMLAAVGAGVVEPDPETEAVGAAILERLAPFVTPHTPVIKESEPAAGTAGAGRLHLSLWFGRESLRSGMDPLSFLRYLDTLGTTVSVEVVTRDLPDTDDFDAECCYLGFEVELETAETADVVLEVFEFVREDGDIRVVPSTPVAAVPAPRAAEPSSDPAPAASSSGSIPVEKRAGTPDRRAAENQTIRVDAHRLDRLIDSVGELVIAGASAGLSASLVGDEALTTSIAEVMRLVEEVRDGALQLRMVPIGTTFGRFQRIVRDVGASLGKDVQLVISGGDTEVDKAVVEQIGDPLTHLVRNALDHGIESGEVRAERGKPASGTLRLNAFHDSGSIVIEVSDDGGGIDPDRVLAKAVERGLVDPAASPTEAEIFDLIFAPGFSTAAQVSDLSGRGVGMDVVKKNITALRGTVDVSSAVGEGTTLRIRLPLTLAIIDGFLVGVGGATYVIPLDRVVECVELPTSGLRGDVMDLRGEVLPFIRLRSLFTVRGEAPRRENVVVVEYAGQRVGLVVDALKGEFQTVIKPLGALFTNVEGIGGSTILGSGDVALIIDVPTLLRTVTEAHARAARV